MKKKMSIIVLAFVMGIFGTISVFAQSRKMDDGTIFDAEFYAEQNPDVVAAVGTDENALYQHYTSAGNEEGRLAVAIQGAAMVSKDKMYDAYNGAFMGYTYTLEDGTRVWRISKKNLDPYGYYDSNYIIPRTDYSTGLIDEDRNGIDDRDPYNNSGYSDLDFNFLVDGAPLMEEPYAVNNYVWDNATNTWKDAEASAYTIIHPMGRPTHKCQHNVVGLAMNVDTDNIDDSFLCFECAKEQEWVREEYKAGRLGGVE